MKRILILMAALVAAALAGDVTGTWKATAEGPNGTMERTFVLKAEGSKLTVKFQDNEMKLNYKGKVSGNEIHFTVENPNGGQTIEWHAKKVS